MGNGLGIYHYYFSLKKHGIRFWSHDKVPRHFKVDYGEIEKKMERKLLSINVNK